ncbi:MAG: hypothetical protein H6Q04_2812 [Acidobacteria bacterium]|jgi:tetratricopeptide (TPR) repeat protein|nr:hypothetical protein [Acidobacteriota bacterium]
MSSNSLPVRNFAAWFIAGGCLLAALLIKPVQDRIEERLQIHSVDPDTLYFSSPAGMKRLAMGYDSVLADIYWMRAIQYYGRRDEADKRPVRYKNLSALLQITVALDPNMLDAYRAGSYFLAEPDPIGAGQPEEALRLLDAGIKRMPHEWRLLYDKGFIFYWFVEDYQAAGQCWLSASRIAGAPEWMEGLAASSLSKGGAVETAKTLWQRQYQESDRADLKENARNHLFSIQIAEHLWALEYFIERYREKTSTYPSELNDLVRAGFLVALPVDPLGNPYEYDPRTGFVDRNPDSKITYLGAPPGYREDFLENLKKLVESR